MKFARPLRGFQHDIDALGQLPVQIMALLLLGSVAEGRVRGVPLSRRAGTADLSDCCKLYFDPVGGQRPRFRLVYRLVADDSGETRVQAVSVGQREGLDAYLRAAKNLGRL